MSGMLASQWDTIHTCKGLTAGAHVIEFRKTMPDFRSHGALD
jgi:hypothetical protein